MSLVAYDASSDEDDDAGEEVPAAGAAAAAAEEQPKPLSPSPSNGAAPVASAAPPPPTQLPGPPPAQSQNVASTSSNNVSLPTPSLDDLPDVAALLASPSLPSHQSMATDHSSRVAAALVESESRKRESNGSAFHDPRSKFPRVQSAQPRGVRNAARSLLIPPQLSGRSNVVTEDMSKLFVNRHREQH